MAEESSKVSVSNTSMVGSGIRLTPNLQVTTEKLNDHNYDTWSESFMVSIHAYELAGYLDGTTTSEHEVSHAKWMSKDAIIKSWLYHSMEPSICSQFMKLKTSKEIWDALATLFSQTNNDAQAFEIRKKSRDLRQGDLSVTAYYSELVRLWQQLDSYRTCRISNVSELTAFQLDLRKERVYDFLYGLNPVYDSFRAQILGRVPFPSLEEAFFMIRFEESRSTVMMPPVASERSALISHSTSERSTSDIPRLFCDHCKKPGHIKDMCFVLHPHLREKFNRERGNRGRGKKNHSSSGGRPQAHFSEELDDSSPPSNSTDGFTPTQLLQIQHLIAQQQIAPPPTSSGTSYHTQSGICAFSVAPRGLSWLIDSGANEHMTSSSEVFDSYTPVSGKIKVADGSFSSIAGKGSIQCTPNISLSSVLHVPNLCAHLISIYRTCLELNCSVTFFSTHCIFQELGTGRTIATGRVQDGLYYLDSNLPHSSAHVTQTQSLSLLHQWHQRLGHPSFRVLSSLFPSLAKSCTHETFVCDVCELSKHTRANYPLSLNKSDVPFSIIHSDLWVCRHTSIDGFKYFVTFIDNCTRLTCVYLLRTKNEVFSCFRSYHAMIRTQFNAKVQIFRSDNGTEYIDGNFRSYLDEHGILPQTSCVGTPQQNGIPERKNRHLLNVTRSIMFSMHVPKIYWSHAVATASYLINRVPSQVLDFKTPISLLPKSSLPTSLPLRVFGCVCFVHNSNPSRDKLDLRAFRCVFLGYSTSQKGYKCYHPPTRKMFITMDVTFRETEAYFPPSLQGELSGEEMSRGFEQSFSFPLPLPSVPLVLSEGEGEISSQSQAEASRERENPFIPQKDFGIVYARKNQIPREQSIQVPPRQSPPLPVPDPGNDTLKSVPHVENSDIPIALRKGVRTCTKYPIANFMSYEKISPAYRVFLSSLSSVSIPQSWKEAAMNPKWKEAMNEEMRALKKNETWELVPLPAGKKTVGCKWVFTVKQNVDGIIERFKARLVAKGFTQTYGVDYQETFAPVAKMDSIRALLSCAANLGWSLHQLDVKNAYLHGNLEEEVYMDIPPGFSSQITDGKVCRLKKALYGLKQSPRAWFGRFLHAMLKIGYKQSHADHTMFVRREGEKITVLIVYVDDIVVTGNHEAEISQLKSLLAKEFEIKDLGPLKYFLGIEVAQSKSGIFISQRKYVLDLLAESGMLGCKPANSPIEANHHLCGGVGEPADRGRYQRLVGRLIYLAHTRPDIAYAVSVVSRYMHDPRIVHQDAVYRILRYLKSTPGNGILFSNHGHLTLECFTDADWAGSKDDRKSTTGYCTLLGGNLVTWKSKKQSVVSRSSAEAEYRAMAKGTCELIWLKSLLGDLGVMHERPMRLYCDNQAAINIAHNPVQHDRTKHIEVDRNFIKEKLDQKLICTLYVKSKDQIADIFTKGLGCPDFHCLVSKLGMRNLYAPT